MISTFLKERVNSDAIIELNVGLCVFLTASFVQLMVLGGVLHFLVKILECFIFLPLVSTILGQREENRAAKEMKHHLFKSLPYPSIIYKKRRADSQEEE